MRVSNLMRSKRFWTLAVAGIICIGVVYGFFYARRFIRYQEPKFLTFHELQELYKNPNPGGLLGWKLEAFRRTPIISNEAYYGGARPLEHTDPKLGPYLTLASWNIQESINIKDAIAVFTAPDQFPSMIDPGKAAEGSPEYKEILRQRERLAHADIIVLQEMDVGVKRSGYLNAAGELAKALKMNYTFADEQLELDPLVLGVEKIYQADGKTVD